MNLSGNIYQFTKQYCLSLFWL